MKVYASIVTSAIVLASCSFPTIVHAGVGGGVPLLGGAANRMEPAPPADTAQSNGWDAASDETPSQAATAGPPPPPRVETMPGPAVQPTPRPLVDHEEIRKRNKTRGLMIGGWTTFGITYAAALTIGVVTIDTAEGDDAAQLRRWGRRMTIPIGGPLAAAAVSRTATGTLFSVLTSAAQTTGLALGIVGAVMYAKHRREQRLAFSIVPDGAGVGVGATYKF